MSLYRGWRFATNLCLGIVITSANVNVNAASWLRDPFKIERKTSPAPDKRWEATEPLPEVKGPPSAVGLSSDRSLTLPELTEYALRNNPRTRQAWFSARAAAAGLGVVIGDDLPTISGSLVFQRQRPVSATSGTVSPWLNRYGPAISLSYTLYDFGVGDDRVEAAEYRLLAANLAQNRVLQEVKLQVEQAYYQLIGTEALVRVNEQAVKNVETVLEAVRRRRESGLATIADVYRSETQVAQARLLLTRGRGEFSKARGLLAATVGLPINSTIKVQMLMAPPQTKQVVTSVADFLERVKSSRPDLIAAEAQVRAARATASAASKAGLPSIEISGNSVTYDFHPDRPTAHGHSLNLNMRIPIFSGFKDTYTLRQTEAQVRQAEAARDVLYRQTQLEVWQGFYDLQTVSSSISSTEAQVKSAEQTAEATLARYSAGFGTILDLITSQQDETNARVQRIQSYLDWFTTLARLHAAVGAGDLLNRAGEAK